MTKLNKNEHIERKDAMASTVDNKNIESLPEDKSLSNIIDNTRDKLESRDLDTSLEMSNISVADFLKDPSRYVEHTFSQDFFLECVDSLWNDDLKTETFQTKLSDILPYFKNLDENIFETLISEPYFLSSFDVLSFNSFRLDTDTFIQNNLEKIKMSPQQLLLSINNFEGDEKENVAKLLIAYTKLPQENITSYGIFSGRALNELIPYVQSYPAEYMDVFLMQAIKEPNMLQEMDAHLLAMFTTPFKQKLTEILKKLSSSTLRSIIQASSKPMELARFILEGRIASNERPLELGKDFIELLYQRPYLYEQFGGLESDDINILRLPTGLHQEIQLFLENK